MPQIIGTPEVRARRERATPLVVRPPRDAFELSRYARRR